MRPNHEPTPEALLAVPPLIIPDLDVLFCGINPGLSSGRTGRHFARPGNRFWPALYRGGWTERLLLPTEERALLAAGCGITSLVARPTATAAELAPAEYQAGAVRLARLAEAYTPRWVAILGLGAYRTGFKQPKAQVGPQEERIGGARVWLLPNPSGLNAHYTLETLGALFAELRRAVRGDA